MGTPTQTSPHLVYVTSFEKLPIEQKHSRKNIMNI